MLTTGWSIASLNASLPPASRALITLDFRVGLFFISSAALATTVNFSISVLVGLF